MVIFTFLIFWKSYVGLKILKKNQNAVLYDMHFQLLEYSHKQERSDVILSNGVHHKCKINTIKYGCILLRARLS